MTVADHLQSLQQSIRQACEKSGRAPSDITIIAVTKYVTIDRAKEALAAGVNHLGENRKEEFLEKYQAIEGEAFWHFIGSLQSRKVKDIISYVDMIHSLDRRSLAKEINKRADQHVACFVQVNVSGEASKHGVAPDEVVDFVHSLEDFPNIKVVGLMTMAPHIEDEDKLRGIFRNLKALQIEIQSMHLNHAPCDYLSMGMSNDFQIAIEEGATHIRIGSSLVGD
ncbi:YggS family pyridoxal phosphate-dependent enzyme [Thalassobacillus sp. CUG 92003]|uniref:YggS family pyridoxal phosphate-dependent enzyme n=1 Tax=Thalassobacillus sp. CUG 92003 TaxID=2736641 RepID=UPI0015E6B811|nr:YggS family pyridoxal phosphate-dependent enzyme [Thalassobacillus sp. CUG 92003]